MIIRRYRELTELPAQALDFLAQDDMRNTVPYGVLRLMQQDPKAFQDYEIFLVTDADTIQLYAHWTPPYPPYLSMGAPEAIAALALELKAEGARLPGLLGPLEATEAFLDAWPELRKGWPLVERQGFYRLDAVTMPPPSGGEFEVAKMEDWDLYCEWLKAFCFELNDFYPGDEKVRQLQKTRLEAGDLHCLSLDGKPRSMAVAGRRTIHGRCVSFVYTPPDARGQGYAAELVARLSQKILDQGAQYCCLFTQLDNPISNRIYQRMGYQFVCEFRKYGPETSVSSS